MANGCNAPGPHIWRLETVVPESPLHFKLCHAHLLEPLLMNLMATSRIFSLSSANRTNAELPSPSSATLAYLGCFWRGSGVLLV